MKIIESIGVVGVVLMVSASSASITELDAGQSVAVEGVRILDDFSLIGSGPSFFTPFTVMGDGGTLFEGSFGYSAVTRHDTGEIDLYWRVRADEDYAGEVVSVTIDGYSEFSVGVAYRTDLLGSHAPTTASRSLDADIVEFAFDDPAIQYPSGTREFMIRTDALDFDMSGTARITLASGEFVDLATFAPVVPTPSALAVIGFGGLLAGRRR